MKQRFLVIIRYLVPLFILCLLSGIGFWAAKNSFLEVKEVDIVGHEDTFSTLAFLKKPRNLLFIFPQALTTEIKREFPVVRNVIIHKEFPNTLRIEIEERKPLFIMNEDQKQLLIDPDGVLMPNSSRFMEKNLIHVACGVHQSDRVRVTDSSLVSLFSLVAILQKDLPLSVTNVVCVDQYTAVMTIGKTNIKISLPIEKQAALTNSLQFLFKQFRIEGKYPYGIDLRFAKPVLTLEQEEVESSASDSTQAH